MSIKNYLSPESKVLSKEMVGNLADPVLFYKPIRSISIDRRISAATCYLRQYVLDTY